MGSAWLDFHDIQRRLFWNLPPLHLVYLRLRGFELELADCDLVIQGFPRQGNTFLAIALPTFIEGLAILSHLHSPAILYLAQKKSIPALLPIRKPEQAIPSLSLFNNWPLRRCLNHYRDYYACSLKYADYCRVIEFEEFTRNPAALIVGVAEWLGKPAHPGSNEAVSELVFEKIDERFAINPASSDFSRQIHRPQANRDSDKQAISSELREKYAGKLSECENLYRVLFDKRWRIPMPADTTQASNNGTKSE